jgi:divalent metal cation (Fe/Co/Zn/Cd) transporter
VADSSARPRLRRRSRLRPPLMPSTGPVSQKGRNSHLPGVFGLPVSQTASVADGKADGSRSELLRRALTLSYLSVTWGLLAGAWAVTSGLLAGSLGVLGLGLNILADVAGSIGLVWRFGVERRDPTRGIRAEARASMVVACALILVAGTLVVAATYDLVTHSEPGPTVVAMVSAGISAAVLAPLGWAKYRTGQRLNSHALMGDGTLSGLGSVLGICALLALLTDSVFGWWWADRFAAFAVAAVACAEAIRVVRAKPD